MQLTQAVLLVEGMHDEMVLSHYFRRDLDLARIEIVPIRGVLNAMSRAEPEFLSRMGIPLIGLFDRVTQDALDGGPASSAEERFVQGLMQIGSPIHFVPFEEPDIL